MLYAHRLQTHPASRHAPAPRVSSCRHLRAHSCIGPGGRAGRLHRACGSAAAQVVFACLGASLAAADAPRRLCRPCAARSLTSADAAGVRRCQSQWPPREPHSPISGYSVRVSGSSVKVPRAVAGASTSAPARPSGGGFESGVRRAAAPTQPAVVRGAARPLQLATLRLHGAEHDGQEQECGAGGAMPSAWCSSARSHAGLCVLLQPRTAMLRR